VSYSLAPDHVVGPACDDLPKERGHGQETSPEGNHRGSEELLPGGVGQAELWLLSLLYSYNTVPIAHSLLMKPWFARIPAVTLARVSSNTTLKAMRLVPVLYRGALTQTRIHP
jgi:hypothetical protein